MAAPNPWPVSIQVEPECEIIDEETETHNSSTTAARNACEKNPGHLKFIPIKDFKIHHLPTAYQNDAYLNMIKWWADLTVKITVNFTSFQRPDNNGTPYPYSKFKGSERVKRCGTGFVMTPYTQYVQDVDCPCIDCRQSNNPKNKFLFCLVYTSSHVIFDDSEAEKSVFELFYDSEDTKSEDIKLMYGVGVKSYVIFVQNENEDEAWQIQKCHTDYIQLECVTHVLDLYPALSDRLFRYVEVSNDHSVPDMPAGVMVSHRHGDSKTITVGNFLHRRTPIPPDFNNDGFEIKLAKGTNYRPNLEFSETMTEHETQTEFNPSKQIDSEVISTLSNEMMLKIPSEATYLCQFEGLRNSWASFYPGSQLVMKNSNPDDGSKPEYQPSIMSVNGVQLDLSKYRYSDFNTKTRYMFCLCYNIPSCKGSSRAPVLCFRHKLFFATHSGSLQGHQNLSSVNTHYQMLDDVISNKIQWNST